MTVEEVLKNNTNSTNFNDNDLIPMTYKEFAQMSDEEQKAYLEELRERFDATDAMIAELLGVTRAWITRVSIALGAESRNRTENDNRRRFYDWVQAGKAADSGTSQMVRTVAHMSFKGVEEEDESASVEEDDSTSGSMELHSTLGDAATMLQAMATRDSHKYVVHIAWSEKILEA